MVSAVDVANMALDTIGARYSITSLDPPQPPPNANLVARHYQPKIDALHRSAHWSFARRQAKLSLLMAAIGTPENPNGTTLPLPPPPWQYAYAYPSDCLAARFLVADNPPQGQDLPVLAAGAYATPLWPWNPGWTFIVGNALDANGNQIRIILTDLEFAQLVYTVRVTDPDVWDPQFLLASTAYLGAWLVNPTSGDGDMLRNMIGIVKEVVGDARVADGNEAMTSNDYVPDWMQVRGIAGYNIVGGPNAFYGWSPLGFPGGGFF
jgi:hypothetical protein